MKKYDNSAVLFKNIINRIETNKEDFFFSDFMDPFQQKILSREINKHSKIEFHFFGGYEDSERKMFGMFDNNLEIIQWPILIICFDIGDFHRDLNHRMVLGSIMSLGITRDTIGDIIINKNHVQVIVQEHIAPYIRDNLHDINKMKVLPEINTVESLSIPEQQYKDEKIVVNSLRIDGIVSSGWNVSREESTQLVKKGLVRINHVYITKPSSSVSIGDLISVKGKGRFIIHEFLGSTRKDKKKLLIKKYL